MNIRHARRLGVALLGATLGVAMLSSTAMAEVTGLVVTSSMKIGPYGGKEYRYIQGTLQGTAPGGDYAVPVELAFPVEAGDFNGFALLDVIAMNTIGTDFVPGGRPYPTRPIFGDDYLFGEGNVYIGVLWDRARLETLGVGTVAAAGDEYEIFRDAAALVRDPAIAGLHPNIAPARGVDRVIATGFSITANLLRSWFHHGLNQAGGTLVFDGALLGSARTVNCTNRATTAAEPCDITRTDGAKIISLMTEWEMSTRGPIFRGDTADYRQYEIPGLSHIPAPVIDFRPVGFPDQNPIDPGPVYRAALTALQAWLDGTAPPPSIYLDVPVESTRTVDGDPFWDAARDADGNALAGVRLPHVVAPLGEYRSTRETDDEGNIGYWVPFTTEQIRARYPTRDAYVAAVTAAAEELVEDRYILQADADAYIAAAEAATYWN